MEPRTDDPRSVQREVDHRRSFSLPSFYSASSPEYNRTALSVCLETDGRPVTQPATSPAPFSDDSVAPSLGTATNTPAPEVSIRTPDYTAQGARPKLRRSSTFSPSQQASPVKRRSEEIPTVHRAVDREHPPSPFSATPNTHDKYTAFRVDSETETRFVTSPAIPSFVSDSSGASFQAPTHPPAPQHRSSPPVAPPQRYNLRRTFASAARAGQCK